MFYSVCRHIVFTVLYAETHSFILINSPLGGTSATLIAKSIWPTWGPPGADRTLVGPRLAIWTLLYGIYTLGENVTQPDNTHRRSFSAQYIPVSPFSGGKIWLCPSLSLFPGEIARPGKMQGLSKILVVPVITAINTARSRHSTFQDNTLPRGDNTCY